MRGRNRRSRAARVGCPNCGALVRPGPSLAGVSGVGGVPGTPARPIAAETELASTSLQGKELS